MEADEAEVPPRLPRCLFLQAKCTLSRVLSLPALSAPNNRLPSSPAPEVTARAWILRSCPLSLLSCLRVRSLLDLRPSPAFSPNWNAALGSISLFCLYACARGRRPGLA